MQPRELELVDGERTGEWLIERRIRSSRDLALWNEATLNTLRIYTLVKPSGEAQILGAVLKTGSGPGLADNAHLGGIYVCVDLERERLIGDGIGEDVVTRRTHPVSGKAFHGAAVPGSKRAAEAALAAARATFRTPFVGWDIALDERDEAVIIEGNSSPGLTPLQRTHGGMASVLGRHLKARKGDRHR